MSNASVLSGAQQYLDTHLQYIYIYSHRLSDFFDKYIPHVPIFCHLALR